MKLFRPCMLAERVYPEAIFRIKTDEKLLCLTFDDGPDPQSTPQLLEILERYNIKALFFCNGMAAEKQPDLIEKIRQRGHMVGNHGYNHLDGWRTSIKTYIADVALASEFTSSLLFRPPYGRLKIGQYNKLKEIYRIFFWDIMPYDFDSRFGSERSLKILKKKVRAGSIIVLHDTSQSCASIILEEFIPFAISEGYSFVLPPQKQ